MNTKQNSINQGALFSEQLTNLLQEISTQLSVAILKQHVNIEELAKRLCIDEDEIIEAVKGKSFNPDLLIDLAFELNCNFLQCYHLDDIILTNEDDMIEKEKAKCKRKIMLEPKAQKILNQLETDNRNN